MNTYTEHDRHKKRYGKAEDELVGWFSCAIGVKAQNMDSSGGGTDMNERHYDRLRALQRGQMAWFDRVKATIAQLPREHQRVIMLVYTPHAAPTWLQDALSTPWGGGSFTRLVVALPRLAKAHELREDTSRHRSLVDWMVVRGGTRKDPLWTSLREDGEALRMPAIVAYHKLMVERIKAEQVAERDAARRRSEENVKLFTKLVGRKRRRDRERAAKRTGIAA